MDFDIASLIRDKYNGDSSVDLTEDLKRLAAGEPPAYVIGWIPFLDLRIYLESHPLIPRPETEWWTEKLIQHLQYRFRETPFHLVDLCAGSGAIGFTILKAFPQSHVSFGELMPEHVALIQKNIQINGLDASRATVCESNLFDAFSLHEPLAAYDIIAANPPYIPEQRVLDKSVTQYEPLEALFAGTDGMSIIRKIVTQAPKYLLPDGELWLECDISNVEAAQDLALEAGAIEATIHADQYGRPRLLVAHFS